MKCESCWEDITSKENSIVEWLALANGVCLVHSIRVAHKHCAYYDTQKDKLDQENLFDRWLPLSDLENLLDLALDMDWDNKYDAELHLKEILKKEVIDG